jgi:hypothetical protein
VAISISVPSDEKYLTAIEKLIETTIPRTPLPWSPEEGSAEERPRKPDASV